jgi:predicted pyridoxine 5'-phosphate oxidase superfamily flavin-nucleotide-binding protein
MADPKPPYHAGELDVQRRAGVEEDARHLVGMVQARLSARAVPFLAGQSMAVATSLDPRGRPWASLLTGAPGFVQPIDDTLLLLATPPPSHDPLAANLAARRELGLLVIDLATRRRMRFNGQGVVDPVRGILLTLEQAYGNCPKYIQSRKVEVAARDAGPPEQSHSKLLTRRQQALIGAADTFFIASVHPDSGPDASHRGGRPGFVRVLDDKTLVFPDYAGNNMFNTLGNLVVEPRTGLLFLDFESGDVLQLAGSAALDWRKASIAKHRGAEHVVVTVTVDEVLETRGVGVRGRLLEYSPVNP